MPGLAATTPAGTYEFFDSVGVRHLGAIADAGTIMPGGSDQVFNASLYRTFTVLGDSDLTGGNIETGVQIFGATGTLTPAPGNCSANGVVGCVTTSTFKSADLANLVAGNIKNGVAVAGVTGAYPSVANPLVGADVGTADLPVFAATSGGTSYEWFASDGSRLTGTIEADASVTPGTSNQTLNSGLYRSVVVSGDSNLDAGNIKDGVTIFGVPGTVIPTVADCGSNGEVGCVTTLAYKAADLTNLLSGSIKSGVSIAGVTGSYPSFASPLAGADGGVSDLTSLDAATPAGSYEFFDSTGARYTGTVADAGTITPGSSGQTFNAGIYRGFTVAGDSDLIAVNIKSGVQIFGATGSLTPAPSNCLANAEVGCVTTATFQAADLSNLVAGNIKNGVTLAGVTGAYPSVASPLVGADGATADLPAFTATSGGASYEWFASDGSRLTGTIEADANVTPGTSNQTLNSGLYRSVTVDGDADLVASNIKTSVSLFGVTGNVVPSAANCASDGEVGCVTTGSYKAANMTNVIPGNIKLGVVIAGETGSLSGAPVNCSSNGEQGCVTTSTYKAADLSNLLSANIKNGVTIAGTAGTYPSFATPLQGASGAVSDLQSLAANTAAGNYEFFDSTGARYTGSITDAGTITPGTTNQNFTTSLYRQFTVVGDADLLAGNVKAAVQIFNVTGTVTAAPANCSSNAEVGCVTTSAYKAADLSNLTAGNVKSGVSLAGVTGDYPSVTNPLATSDGTTDLPAFSSTVGGTTYEWFKSDGSRLTGTVQTDQTVAPSASNQTLNTGLYRSVTVNGDADLVAGNILSGVNLFGVAGSVTQAPANCSTNGTVGCVTTATYKSADLTNLLAANVKNGITIAGTAGTYPSLATPLTGASGIVSDLQSLAANTAAGSYEFFDSTGARYLGSISNAGTVMPGTSDQNFTTSLYRQFTVAGDADLAAGNIRAGVQIFSVTGTVTPAPSDCSADNQTGCVTTSTYKSADTGAFAASDLKSGKTVAGVAGSLVNCSVDGAQGCVTTATYKAANMASVTAANIKSGVTIAGQLGDYPSATNRLAGADGTTDLPTFASTTGGSTYEWFQSDGSRMTASVQANQTVTPSASNQTLNAGLYRSVTVNGDANLVAGKVKKGVTMFGVTGDYPSATNPLTDSDSTADLTLGNFDAQVKSASAFEWFDEVGTRYTNSGDPDKPPIPTPIRRGISAKVRPWAAKRVPSFSIKI